MKQITQILCVICTLALSNLALAVPSTLNHQGRIFLSDSQPATGSSNATFKLYTSATGGSAVWTQTLAVTFDNGHYSVTLGPGSPNLSTELFDGENIYLGITLEGVDEFEPRTTIASVPYAFRAGSVTGEVNAQNGLSVNGQEIIDSSGNTTIPGLLSVDGGMALPRATTDELPNASESNAGFIYYVSDQDAAFVSNGSEWVNITDGGGSGNGDLPLPVIASLSPDQVEPEQDSTVTINGQGFEDGCEVEFGTTLSPSVTFVNTNQIEAATGDTLASGLYNVRITNPVGLRGTETDGLAVDAAPVWDTSEGDLGVIVDAVDREHFILAATDSEGQTLTYELTSGSLPGGVVLNSETGVISGDPDDVSDDVTTEFTVTVTDTARTPHVVERTFSVTVTHMLGQVPEAPGNSCKHIMDLAPTAEDGEYWIKPNSDPSYLTYCDMTTDGGGWSLIGIISSHDGIGSGACNMTWHYASANWTNASVFAEDSFNNEVDHKYASYSNLPFTHFMMNESVNNVIGWKSWSFGSQTDFATMMGGGCTTIASSAAASGGTITSDNALIYSNNMLRNCNADYSHNNDTSRLHGNSPNNPNGNCYNGCWGLGCKGDNGCSYNSEARPQRGGWTNQCYSQIVFYTGGRVWGSGGVDVGHFVGKLYVR